MPLKINIGLSKKLGLPDFDSLGANCHVEFELPQASAEVDLEAFQQRVRSAHRACHQAVTGELARQQESDDESHGERRGRSGSATNGTVKAIKAGQIDLEAALDGARP